MMRRRIGLRDPGTPEKTLPPAEGQQDSPPESPPPTEGQQDSPPESASPGDDEELEKEFKVRDCC